VWLRYRAFAPWRDTSGSLHRASSSIAGDRSMPSTSYQRHSSSSYRPVPHATSGGGAWRVRLDEFSEGPVVVRTMDQVVQLRGFTGPVRLLP
jgi:hypothetical protein